MLEISELHIKPAFLVFSSFSSHRQRLEKSLERSKVLRHSDETFAALKAKQDAQVHLATQKKKHDKKLRTCINIYIYGHAQHIFTY